MKNGRFEPEDKSFSKRDKEASEAGNCSDSSFVTLIFFFFFLDPVAWLTLKSHSWQNSIGVVYIFYSLITVTVLKQQQQHEFDFKITKWLLSHSQSCRQK